MVHILGQLLFGLVVGIIARFLLPGQEHIPAGPLGWLLTALLGVAGSFIGGYIARLIWKEDGHPAGWILSILGAILLLLLLRFI
ncbi:MAG: GlsB/YeaQ/YmgE family stress response membrane protein [Pyrinomonadaceae bacterium]